MTAPRISHNKMESALKIQLRVIGAIILRDMRTRFGRTYLSFAIQVGWPLTHLAVVMIAYLLAHKIAPVGTDVTVFPASGLLPYILCLYPARMTMLGIAANKPLLMFPVVKSPDLVFARAILEVITAFCVFLIFVLVLLPFDPDIVPPDPATAMMALFATVYLGVTFGFFSAMIFSIFRMWLPAQIGILMIMYFASGALFVTDTLSQSTLDILWFNPLFHCVQWLRSAYYLDYGNGMISPVYVLVVSTAFLAAGFLLERLARGRMLVAA